MIDTWTCVVLRGQSLARNSSLPEKWLAEEREVVCPDQQDLRK
jgi:hypothetical protein